MKNRQIRAYDMDGCMCREICWTKRECLNATPNKKVIRHCNSHFDDSITIIYTGRKDSLMSETIIWLRDNNVKYWAISNQKLRADYYYDDHAINVKDI